KSGSPSKAGQAATSDSNACSPYVGPIMDSLAGTYLNDLEPKFHRECNECFWVNADYLAAFMRPMRLNVPLITVGAASDALPGAIGQPGTAVIFGGNNIDFNRYDGIHVGVGVFLDRCDRFSLEAQGFYLFGNNSSFTAAADANGNPIIARPFFNSATGAE